MQTTTSRVLGALALIASYGLRAAVQATAPAQYTVEPAPGWVRPHAASAQGDSPGPGDVVQYSLIDRQIRIGAGSESYTHVIVTPLNADGVARESQIQIEFDPQREHLHLHRVELRRGTKAFDQLRIGRRNVLRRESSLEHGVLLGTLTFNLVMSDVRVGDVIDYSYTIEHRDGEWGGLYANAVTTQWDEPAQDSYLRILSRAQPPLALKFDPASAPTVTQSGEWIDRQWHWPRLAGFVMEPDAPGRYVQHPNVQYSQFSSWEQVRSLALPLYALPPSTADLDDQIRRIRDMGGSQPEVALRTLRFVQEEIRYTGIEIGTGAYQPTAPGVVLSRRYGDCKDKTLLAVALLRGLGFDAAPALVSTHWERLTHTRQPGPGAFDHAVVRLRIANRTYWIDVTSTAQGGTLDTMEQADFGEALVLATDQKGLESIPAPSVTGPTESAVETFDLRQGLEATARLEVQTVYRGTDADDMRRKLRGSTPADLSRQYAEYYASRYPGIRPSAPIDIHDDRDANVLRVDEHYDFDKPFVADGKGERTFEVEAESINAHLKAPRHVPHSFPWLLSHPVSANERIVVRLPSFFPVKDETKTVDTAQFHYESRVTHADNDVMLEYSYVTRTDEVMPADFPRFAEQREQARQDSYFSFTSGDSHDPGADASQAAWQSIKQAAQLMQKQEVDRAYTGLKPLLDRKDFDSFAPELQHAALLMAGTLQLDKRDANAALASLRRATSFQQAGEMDWTMRWYAALGTDDHADATLALTQLAERWPKSLAELDTELIGHTAWQAPRIGSGRYHLLKALFAAHYSAGAQDLSDLWRDLALLEIERDDPDAAQQALAAVTAPRAIIGVRADNRFASLRARMGSKLDVAAALGAGLESARNAVAAAPDKLEPVLVLASRLDEALRFEEALRLCDQSLARIKAGQGHRMYVDYDRYFPWLLDARAGALFHLGRYDEAVAQLQTASHMQERGSDNVSQVINLADMYAQLGRTAEAEAALGGVSTTNASPYGQLQVAEVRLWIAIQRGDAPERQRQLDYLREHEQDSVETLQDTLVHAGEIDSAAKLLVARLLDPDRRQSALLEVQGYAQPEAPESVVRDRERWSSLLQREDVREAIGKVGSVEDYPLLPARR